MSLDNRLASVEPVSWSLSVFRLEALRAGPATGLAAHSRCCLAPTRASEPDGYRRGVRRLSRHLRRAGRVRPALLPRTVNTHDHAPTPLAVLELRSATLQLADARHQS